MLVATPSRRKHHAANAGGETVELVGAGTLVQATADGSVAITVPADADAIVVGWAGFMSGDSTFSELNLDGLGGQDFVEAASASWSGGPGMETRAYVMAAPPVGQQTLTYAFASAVIDGAQIFVFYLKNVSATPVGDTDSGNATNGWTSALTVGAKDMAIIMAYGYDVVPDVNPSGFGQTVIIEQAPYNLAGLSIGFEIGESEMRVQGTDIVVPLAFVIKAAE